MERNDCTVGDYLLTRLKQIGVDHLFGVPGDFVLAFFNQVLKSPRRRAASPAAGGRPESRLARRNEFG